MRDISEDVWDKVLGKENAWCRSLKVVAEIVEHDVTTEVHDVVTTVTDDIVCLVSYTVEQVRYD